MCNGDTFFLVKTDSVFQVEFVTDRLKSTKIMANKYIITFYLWLSPVRSGGCKHLADDLCDW